MGGRAAQFNLRNPALHTVLRIPGRIMQVRTGIGNTHYEWTKPRARCVQVAVHFEDSDRETNMHNLGCWSPW